MNEGANPAVQRSPAGRRGLTLPAVRLVQAGALVAVLVVNLYWADPYYNFDLVPYIAAAYRLEGASAAVTHQRTYSAAAAAVPADQYALLIGMSDTRSSAYRRTLAADPEALDQQLPSYTMKPAYPALILVLERLGLNPVRASILISRVAYVLTGIVLLYWLAPLLPPLAAVAAAWMAMSLGVVLDPGRLSTPDALSTLLVLTALWLVFERRLLHAGAGLLLLSLAVRPDNLLWLFAVAGYLAVWLRRTRAAAAFSIAGIGTFLALTSWSGAYDWKTQFHGSFVELLAYPAAFEPTLTTLDYLWIYLRESHPANLPLYFPLFVLIGGVLAAHRLRRNGWSDAGVALLAVAGAFVALHWLIYPGDERFLPAAYLAVLVVLIGSLPVGPRAAAPATMSAIRPAGAR